ncbi:MAG: 30S ribosomal protein S9 [Bacteroidales bacterium]|jgi:small subunit ribosomal protein S9|nr:30S ribosomal protein S9 [Bacteroidales bacterium]
MDVINALGRRKKAIARVYIQDGKGEIQINGRDIKEYFSTSILQYVVQQPFQLTNTESKYDLKVILDGGGITGQAEALRLAISRALIKIDPEHRTVLKSNGMLRRDPRMVERKKPGQKKARKKFQFSKR